MSTMTEYGNVNDSNRSRIEVIRTHYSSKVRADVSLLKATPGFEPAGSMARFTNGYYAVMWTQHGAFQGRRYRLDDFDSAQKHYDTLTWADYGKHGWQK